MVSIHALLAECDINQNRKTIDYESFNPRTPCGVRLIMWGKGKNIWKFQSTHSLRSATLKSRSASILKKVSIHALLAECDRASGHALLPLNRFNPRTPCGVRPVSPSNGGLLVEFQSTHSLRSATGYTQPIVVFRRVSIHALLAECDARCHRRPQRRSGFNPRTPCGVRLAGYVLENFDDVVSIHALLAECDNQLPFRVT